jgi:hypothetical protein
MKRRSAALTARFVGVEGLGVRDSLRGAPADPPDACCIALPHPTVALALNTPAAITDRDNRLIRIILLRLNSAAYGGS